MSRPIFAKLLRFLFSHSWSRVVCNSFFQLLSFQQMGFLHGNFGGIYQGYAGLQVDPGFWRVDFLGKEIRLPVRSDNIEYDWTAALGFLGHDWDVKESYKSILRYDRPDIFVDIGANMGTHSLLFLMHGVEVISFEPNKQCHPVFQQQCRLNHVQENIQPYALGDVRKTVQIVFPEGETWLGSVDQASIESLADKKRLRSETVEQKVLDDYLPVLENKKIVIKIDAEGSEQAILRGAKKVIDTLAPSIIFESWQDESRVALYEAFSAYNYGVAALPLDKRKPSIFLTKQQYLANPATNFIAIPQ